MDGERVMFVLGAAVCRVTKELMPHFCFWQIIFHHIS